MVTMTIWWVGAVLEILVLVRGFRERLFGRFPIFYGYLLFVTIDDVLRMAVYRWFPTYYDPVYWVTQFISLAVGSGIIFEIYRVALRAFPGAARMARYLLLLVFGAIFARTLAMPSGDLIERLASGSLILERNLRIVQALAILTLVSLFLWYAIPFGKNLKGILIGYGLFVGISVLQFALWYYKWEPIRSVWSNAEAVSYLVVLGIWTKTLWSFQAAPELQPENRFEQDYELIVASTREQFRRTLARLGWAVRA